MQQQAISQVIHRAPGGTVLTAWPATDELRRPELGYVRKPVHVVAIDNFSLPQIETASQIHNYDAALVFATKYELPDGLRWTHFGDGQWNKEYFGYHYDLPPALIAKLLHGDVVWLAKTRGLWAAVLLFDRPQRSACQRRCLHSRPTPPAAQHSTRNPCGPEFPAECMLNSSITSVVKKTRTMNGLRIWRGSDLLRVARAGGTACLGAICDGQ